MQLKHFPTPFLPIMDRYIISEWFMPFLFGVGAFSSVYLAVGSVFSIVREVTESGLPLGVAIRFLLLKFPESLAYAFPMGTLLAALMVYSRLSSDSELIALRSCGVSIIRLVLPGLVASLLVSGMTFAFNEYVVPAANYAAGQVIDAAVHDDQPQFHSRNILYEEFLPEKSADGQSEGQALSRIFYAKSFNGRAMGGLTVLDFSQTGLNQIIVARTGVWNPEKSQWDFYNGTIYLVSPDGSYRDILQFKHQEIAIPRTPLELAMRGRDYPEMNIAQSEKYLKIIRHSGDEKQITKLEVRIAQRYAFPLVCLVFGLLGTALGIRSRRTDRATGFGISVIVIFGYYLLFSVSGGLGIIGVLTPFIAAWLPNFCGLSISGLMLVRAAR